MRVLLIGGAGGIGRGVLPHLTAEHPVRVLDIVGLSERHRSLGDVGMMIGDVGDPTVVAAACTGVDAVVHLAAVIPFHYTPPQIADAYAVNVGSVHTSLMAAAEAGATSFVHISSMSVFADYGRRPVDPLSQPDATDVYGLTKRLGEDICASLARRNADQFGMTVCSARLAFPTPDDAWPRWVLPHGREGKPPSLDDGTPLPALAMADLAAALQAMFAYRGPYRAFTVTADVQGRSTTDDDGTYEALNWRPRRIGPADGTPIAVTPDSDPTAT